MWRRWFRIPENGEIFDVVRILAGRETDRYTFVPGVYSSSHKQSNCTIEMALKPDLPVGFQAIKLYIYRFRFFRVIREN
jgi:hypothetical protein